MNSIFSAKAVGNWFLQPISSALGSSVSKSAYQFFHGLINGKGAPQGQIGQIDTFKTGGVAIAPKEMDLTERLEVTLFPQKQNSNPPAPQSPLTVQPSVLPTNLLQDLTAAPIPTIPSINTPTADTVEPPLLAKEAPTLHASEPQNLSSEMTLPAPEMPILPVTQNSEPPFENRVLPTQEIPEGPETEEEPDEFDPIPEEFIHSLQPPEKSGPKLPSRNLLRKPIATPETVAKNIGKSFVKLAIAGTTGAYYLVKRSFFAGCQGVLEQGGAEMQKAYDAAATKFPNANQGIRKASSVLKIQELAQKAVQANPFKATELVGAALIAYGLYRWHNSPRKTQEQNSSSNSGSGVVVNVNVQAAPTTACLHVPPQNPPNPTSTNTTGGCLCQHKSQ